MSYENLIYQEDKGVARIVINRPPLNILTIKTMREIAEACAEAEKNPEIRLLTVRGAGSKAFAAGVDVRDHVPELIGELQDAFERVMLAVSQCRKPSLAIVDGVCSGGGFELVLCCDMILATDRSSFSLPEIVLALYPGLAVPLLPRKLPRNVAFEMITTGDPLQPHEAHRLGLVNKVVSQESLEEEVGRFEARYSNKSAKALELARYALTRAYDMEFAKALKTVDDIYFGLVMQTGDANEGILSFLEKRKPVWKHR
ncbi:MAG: enoyl-CoA hydratase/isomerase family protein [Thermodesulfobacteriota bacterium]